MSDVETLEEVRRWLLNAGLVPSDVVQRLVNQLTASQARVKELEQEKAEILASWQETVAIGIKQRDRIATLEQTNQRLVELATGAVSFSQHHHTCGLLNRPSSNTCTCGLEELRAEIKKVKGQQ